LDPVNDEELYWPRHYPTYPGALIQPEEDFGKKTYFKWSLYCIARRPLKMPKDKGLLAGL
jgi:hypothetical protein